MKTSRTKSLVALACITAYVLVAQVELVLCISVDGHVALEAAACGCCDQCADSVAGRLPLSAQPTVARGKGSCSFCCVDMQLHVNGVAFSPPTSRSSKLHELASAPPAAFGSPATAVPPLPLPSTHSPPPNVGLKSLPTVILLI